MNHPTNELMTNELMTNKPMTKLYHNRTLIVTLTNIFVQYIIV